ncbi:MAG: PKD domain-containing protein [Flavobacteriales bacterium]
MDVRFFRCCARWRMSLLLVAAYACGPALQAQPVCDSLNLLGIGHQPLLGTTYQLNTFVLGGASEILDTPQWDIVVQGSHQSLSGSGAQYTFPQEDPYLVCVSALVRDVDQQACKATICEQLDVVPYYPDCHDTLEAQFTISAVDGLTVTFVDATSTTDSITSYNWFFGDDGSSVTGPNLTGITHTFAGNGPYPIVLNVHTQDCWSHIVKWFYSGPANVPCGTFLHPDVRHAEVGTSTSLYDLTPDAGMFRRTTWDLGDGTRTEGHAVIHTYDADGAYPVTCTTQLWGPLAPDTCSHTETLTVVVSSQATAGVDERGEVRPPIARPLPFTDAVTIADGPRGTNARWELLDSIRPLADARHDADERPLHHRWRRIAHRALCAAYAQWRSRGGHPAREAVIKHFFRIGAAR